MKFTQHWAGDPPGRTDSGPDLRGLVWGGRKREDSQETVQYNDVVGARKKTCKGWRVGQGVDATSNVI